MWVELKAFRFIPPVMLAPIENKGTTFQSRLNVTLIFLSLLPSESIFRSIRQGQKASFESVEHPLLCARNPSSAN